MSSVKIDHRTDQRITSRAKVYLSEGLRTLVHGTRFSDEFLIADYTPFGMGLVTVTPDSEVRLEIGEEISLVLPDRFSAPTQRARVANRGTVTWQNKIYTRIGVQFLHAETLQRNGGQRRQRKRFSLLQVAPITCFALDPFQVANKAHFTVEDVGRAGLALLTSSRNKFLMVGGELELSLSVPSKGLLSAHIVIRHIRTSGSGGSLYHLGCEFENPSQELLKALGEYCLNFAQDASFKELQTESFPIDMRAQIFQVQSRNEPDELKDALRLRQIASDAPIHLHDQTSVSHSRDKSDLYARQVLVKAAERVVGAGRIVFVNGHLTRSALLAAFPEQFPEYLRQSRFVELSRFSIHPEYRDGTVMVQLAQELLRISLLDGAEYIVTLVKSDKVSNYAELGFKEQKPAVAQGGESWSFMVARCQDLLLGRGLSIRPWTLTVAPLLVHAGLKHRVPVGLWTLGKAHLSLLLKPVFIPRTK